MTSADRWATRRIRLIQALNERGIRLLHLADIAVIYLTLIAVTGVMSVVRTNFNGTRRHCGIGGRGGPLLHLSEDRDHILRAEPLHALEQRLVALDDDLRVPVAVAHVDEHEGSEIASAVHPAEEHDVSAHVARAKGAARMRPFQ